MGNQFSHKCISLSLFLSFLVVKEKKEGEQQTVNTDLSGFNRYYVEISVLNGGCSLAPTLLQ